MPAQEVTTTVSIGADSPINEAVALMRMHQTSCISVTRDKECIGTLNDDEITAHLDDPGFDPSTTTAGAILAAKGEATASK